MRPYLDSADLKVWETVMPLGIFHGITTNPTLAAKSGWNYADADFSTYLSQAKSLGAKELHIQAYGPTADYVEFAKAIYAKGQEIGVEAVIKVPLIPDAIAVVPEIKKLGGKILMTACYDASQVLVANALGADYVAPYLGRMADMKLDPLAEARRMQESLEGKNCQLFAASIRSLDLLTNLAASGVPIATISSDLAEQLIKNEHSLSAAVQFDLDANGAT